MFEKTVDFQNSFRKYLDESLAKFNQAGRNGDKPYQAGVVSLTDYDADKEILSFEIRWQAKWVKQFFSDFPYENKKRINIAPSEAETLWKAGKQKPFFIIVNRSNDRIIISNAIVRGKKKVWDFGLLKPEMVKIPAGSFKIGANKVSMKSFYMGKYEVTFLIFHN